MTKFCANPACPFCKEDLKLNGKRLDSRDSHTLCFRCLGVDHDMRNCANGCVFSEKTFHMRNRALSEVQRTGVWPETHMERSDNTHRYKTVSKSRESVHKFTIKCGQSTLDPIRSDTEDHQKAAAHRRRKLI